MHSLGFDIIPLPIASIWCSLPTPVIVEVNSLEWGKSLVENGKGMGLYHIMNVRKEISEGRLKELTLAGEIYVGADALLRADALEHMMTERFITLVREEFESHYSSPTGGIRL